MAIHNVLFLYFLWLTFSFHYVFFFVIFVIEDIVNIFWLFQHKTLCRLPLWLHLHHLHFLISDVAHKKSFVKGFSMCFVFFLTISSFFFSSSTWCATVSGHCAVCSASRACPTSHGTRVADRIYECYVWLSVASSDRPRAAVAIKMNRYIQWCVKVVVQFWGEIWSYLVFLYGVALKSSAGVKNCGGDLRVCEGFLVNNVCQLK